MVKITNVGKGDRMVADRILRPGASRQITDKQAEVLRKDKDFEFEVIEPEKDSKPGKPKGTIQVTNIGAVDRSMGGEIVKPGGSVLVTEEEAAKYESIDTVRIDGPQPAKDPKAAKPKGTIQVTNIGGIDRSIAGRIVKPGQAIVVTEKEAAKYEGNPNVRIDGKPSSKKDDPKGQPASTTQGSGVKGFFNNMFGAGNQSQQDPNPEAEGFEMVKAAKSINDLYAVYDAYSKRSKELEDAINAKGKEIDDAERAAAEAAALKKAEEDAGVKQDPAGSTSSTETPNQEPVG